MIVPKVNKTICFQSPPAMKNIKQGVSTKPNSTAADNVTAKRRRTKIGVRSGKKKVFSRDFTVWDSPRRTGLNHPAHKPQSGAGHPVVKENIGPNQTVQQGNRPEHHQIGSFFNFVTEHQLGQ